MPAADFPEVTVRRFRDCRDRRVQGAQANFVILVERILETGAVEPASSAKRRRLSSIVTISLWVVTNPRSSFALCRHPRESGPNYRPTSLDQDGPPLSRG
jgi:hypothetical protein